MRPLLPLALTILCAAVGRAEPAPLIGRHLLQGEQDDGRRFEVELSVERRPDGSLRVVRVARSSSPGDEELPPRRWRALHVERAGDELRTVFTLPAPRPAQGAADALRAGALPTARGTWQNRIAATYRFAAGEVRESLENLTGLAPEDRWRRAEARGGTLAGRLPLGGSREVPRDGRLRLVVPASGELELTLVGPPARLELIDARGASLAVAPIASNNQLRLVSSAPLGLVTLAVGGAVGHRVQARLRQAAAVPAAQRPWRAPSYYPIYELDPEGRENLEALFHTDGPLERFDRALGLQGAASAVAWEKGGALRSGTSYHEGHYVRRARPRERHAEEDWRVDLDGDGRIAAPAAEVIAGYDQDGDGAVDEDELTRVAGPRALAALLRVYDHDDDGEVQLDREVPRAQAGAADRDGDGALDRDELAALIAGTPALRRQLLAQRRDLVARVLSHDRDGDGRVTAQELVPGAWDFLDDLDLDQDGARLFDDTNLVLALRDGRRLVGARVQAKDGALIVLGGPRGDRELGRARPEEVLALREGADGDLDDETDVRWWGHCDAAALAGILFREPSQRVSVGGVELRASDLQGILVELAMGERLLRGFSWSEGGKLRGSADYAAGFHALLREALGEGRALLCDVSARPWGPGDHEVWNYAVHGFVAELREAPGDDPYVLEARTTLRHTGGARELRYRLHYDAAGEVRADAASRTAWLQAENGEARYLRYLLVAGRLTGAHGGQRNPQVTRERVARLFGGELPWQRPAD
ncbi:MAG: EF-hand domain-containing protein [Planctomycetota bacterium]